MEDNAMLIDFTKVRQKVSDRDYQTFIDGLEDYFKESAFEDRSVGIFGMTEGEVALANALLKFLKRVAKIDGGKDKGKLKPCPFCGHEAVAEMNEAWYWEWEVRCPNCCATIAMSFETESEVIEAWNRRTENEK